MPAPDDIKKRVGARAAGLVKDGATIGIGTGTTVYWLIQELGGRIEKGLHVRGVPTSKETAKLAADAGIEVIDLDEVDRLSLTIDGADEIDPNGNMIKGGGGALLQEKIVAAASDKMIVIVGAGKIVETLGAFPLPVEVIPFGHRQVMHRIEKMDGCRSLALRERGGKVFVSDHGHYIIDCHFETIIQPARLNTSLHDIPGVVETGLFLGMATDAIIGHPDGDIEMKSYRSSS